MSKSSRDPSLSMPTRLPLGNVGDCPREAMKLLEAERLALLLLGCMGCSLLFDGTANAISTPALPALRSLLFWTLTTLRCNRSVAHRGPSNTTESPRAIHDGRKSFRPFTDFSRHETLRKKSGPASTSPTNERPGFNSTTAKVTSSVGRPLKSRRPVIQLPEHEETWTDAKSSATSLNAPWQIAAMSSSNIMLSKFTVWSSYYCNV
mmetsp:Transcript_76957/g.148671  ORF Transcript_76957/g.148671 Transcript_76957/m.148671 type:complete len:206 (-) Transcript_76957:103-720(-)